MNFDLLNQPHPHPLYFFEEGKNDGGADQSVRCSKCQRPLRPPAFSCSDSGCNFNLHQSCIDLPPQIRSPFHPQHPLFRATNNYHCSACWQMPLGQVYKCRQCDFQIDIKCAAADPKSSGLRRTAGGEFRHFSHPHPLALHQQQQNRATKQEIVCSVCQLLIKSDDSNSSHYFCYECDAQFHRKCAELPRQMQDSNYHEHPLVLFPNLWLNGAICNSCKNDCREFVYRCPPCNFNLHVACLKSFNHKHSFTKFRSPAQFVCRACGQEGDEFSWFCVTCHLPVHKKCAELPLTLRIHGHRRHDLKLTYFRRGADFVRNKIDCKFCSEEIKTKFAGYGCYECNYFVHLNCASSQSTAVDAFDSSDDGDDDHKIEISGSEIKHFIHPHSLKFFPAEEIGEDRICNGCMKGVLTTPSNTYGCKQCDFIVHKQCLELPRKKRNFLHKHKLTLISIPDMVFQCEACRQHFHGFAYHCKTCFSTFDTRCGSIRIPFQHPSHEHPLSLDRTNEDHNCEACGVGVKNKLSFRCVRCDFHLDAKCATLPVAVRHRSDAHALELGFVEEEGEEYYCDVCELEREAQVWFYGCRECSFSAHLECVVGEFPHVKSKIHEAHGHPLNLAMKGEGGGCAACGESCGGDLAFECGFCKFYVHAVGQCYHRGTVLGELASTDRCFYYRGIGLHQHPIQNGWTREKLGPYGGRGGSPWEEKVFFSIRGFAVYHKEWVHAFQILHETKNGERLVWSRNYGGNGGSRSEVVFDDPDEYLVSIGGYYSNLWKWGKWTGCDQITDDRNQ